MHLSVYATNICWTRQISKDCHRCTSVWWGHAPNAFMQSTLQCAWEVGWGKIGLRSGSTRQIEGQGLKKDAMSDKVPRRWHLVRGLNKVRKQDTSPVDVEHSRWGEHHGRGLEKVGSYTTKKNIQESWGLNRTAKKHNDHWNWSRSQEPEQRDILGIYSKYGETRIRVEQGCYAV